MNTISSINQIDKKVLSFIKGQAKYLSLKFNGAITAEDLEQEAYLTYFRNVDKFDPTKGVQAVSFFANSIRWGWEDYICRNVSTVRNKSRTGVCVMQNTFNDDNGEVEHVVDHLESPVNTVSLRFKELLEVVGSQISPNEHKLLNLALQDYSNKEIGKLLNISEQAIGKRKKTLYKKIKMLYTESSNL